MLFLNSLIEVPIALPISGNLEGPKITRAIIKIKINSLVPILDNSINEFHTKVMANAC